MPDPDELAAQHETFLEDESRRQADAIEERFERRKAEATVDCPSCEGSGIAEENHGQGLIEALGCPDCQATGKIPASFLEVGGAVLDTSPWECPSRRADGHPDRCGMFDDPPTCSVGDCIIREEETVNG